MSILIRLIATFICFLSISSGIQAEEFILRDINGNIQRLSNYKGKWVLVNFWATWCSPCLSEMPELNNLHVKHKDRDLVVIGIAIDSGSSNDIKPFLVKNSIQYPIVRWDKNSEIQFGQITSLPTSLLFTPGGDPVGLQTGQITEEGIESYINTYTVLILREQNK